MCVLRAGHARARVRCAREDSELVFAVEYVVSFGVRVSSPIKGGRASRMSEGDKEQSVRGEFPD